MERGQLPQESRLQWRFLGITLLWTLLLSLQVLVPGLLSVTLLAFLALPLLVMLLATAKAIQKEMMSQRSFQQQLPEE